MIHKVFSLDQFYSFSGKLYKRGKIWYVAKYLVSAEDKKLITILKKELDKKAERLLHMNIIVKEIIIAKNRLTQKTVILKTKIMCFLSCIEQIYCFRSELMTLCFFILFKSRGAK